jgi:LysM domain
MRGNEHGGIAVLPERSLSSPSVHVVRRGDTLWDICDHYFQNPWEWPRIWGYNPELQNPHWIYPGDQIRMRPHAVAETTGNDDKKLAASTPGSGGFVGRRPQASANTVFLRDQGYIDDDVKDVWGDVGGSPDDQMLLSQGDDLYLDIGQGHDVSPGQELTVFRPIPNGTASGKGTMVAILGTARIEKWDPQTRIARAKLTESIDVIERGAKVGPVTRRFDVVPPQRNDVELWARVMASIYPHVLYGQNQVVFIDKGQKDGLVPGNRLFVVSRGDEYRKTLRGASQFAAAGVHYESDKPADIEKDEVVGKGDDKKYPEEVIGEIRVLRLRDHTAACLVIASSREIERGQRVVARKGY